MIGIFATPQDKMVVETRFLGIMQSLRNRVSGKISVWWQNIWKETRFLGIMHNSRNSSYRRF